MLLALGAGWMQAECVQAGAATLHSVVSIRGADIRLSDLFGDLLPGQDCRLGPAPAPGQRILVPPAQLSAIAEEFGVEWHPEGRQSVSITRQARHPEQTEIVDLLRTSLLDAGMPDGSTITLAGFQSPSLPADMTDAPAVQSLSFDTRSGHFSADLLFSTADEEPVSLRVAGRAQLEAPAVVLAHALPAGAILAEQDLQLAQRPASALKEGSLSTPGDAVGLALAHPMGAGASLAREDLRRPLLVTRGRPVILRLQQGGLLITAAGVSLENGSAGDRIHVLNSLSRAVLVGRVMSGVDIAVDPGTAPFAGPAAQGTGLPRYAADQRSDSYAQEALAR